MPDHRTGAHSETVPRSGAALVNIAQKVSSFEGPVHCVQHEVRILKGHVSKEHVHLMVSAPPRLSVSRMMQYIKGKSSRRLQEEYPTLRRRYWGRHIWACGYYCASSGTVTEEMIKDYIDQHERPPEGDFRVTDEAQ